MRFAALQNRNFALFWGSHILSRTGSEMRTVAFSWHIYQLTGSKLALGVIGACRCVPVLVFGLWGGITADRFDRRRVLIVTQVVMAVVAAALFWMTRAHLATPLAIYAAIALLATATAFDNPARAAFVVNVLPREHLENGLALNVLGVHTATVVGPAVGGVLLAATSLQALYAVDAFSFLPLIVVLAFIRAVPSEAPASEPVGGGAVAGPGGAASGTREGTPGAAGSAVGAASGVRAGPGAAERPRGLRAIADAFRYLRTKPVLIHLMWIDFLATLFAGALLLLPVFSTEVFHRGARGLGWLMAAPAAGAVLAGTFLSSRTPIRRHGAVLLGAVAAYGVSTVLFGLTSSFWLGLVLLAVSGASDAVSTVARQIVRQTIIPDEMRGRLQAIHMLFFVSGPQLGELEAGVLAEVTSARVSVVTGGLACLVMAIGVTAFNPTVRTLRLAPPSPPPERS